MNTAFRVAVLSVGLFLPESLARAGEFNTIQVSKKTHQERSNGYFQVEVSDGSYGRTNFTVHLKKNPRDAKVSTGLARIELIERGQPVGWIPTERRSAPDGGSPYIHFELMPQVAKTCVLVLTELTGDASGNVYRVNLYSYIKEGALNPVPTLEDLVSVSFPKDGYRFSLAEVAKGVTIDYEFVVTQDIEGIIPLPFGPSFGEPPGPSGLHPREKISGNGQLYCIEDFGLGKPADERDETITTLRKGTYVHSFEWDGRNWTGPSDTGVPKGEPFPPGIYEITVWIHGWRLTSEGRTSYEITRKTRLVLKQ